MSCGNVKCPEQTVPCSESRAKNRRCSSQATSLTTTPTASRATADTDIIRPSSKATEQASNARYSSIYAPNTTAAGRKSPHIAVTSLSRATISIISPDIQLEHKHLLLDTMTDTSARNASRALELGQRSSPPKPSAWHESVHRDQLVRVWDTVCDVTLRNPNYPKCTTSQVGSTLNAMVKRCPELAQGKVPLTRDWIEYVLGKALRPPFCTAAMMGRWEILAASGGARSMWGPW